MTIPIVDNSYLEHWELRPVESKITKTTVTLCDKVEKRTPHDPALLPPDINPTEFQPGHREPGLVKQHCHEGKEKKKKKTSLETTQISAARRMNP